MTIATAEQDRRGGQKKDGQQDCRIFADATRRKRIHQKRRRPSGNHQPQRQRQLAAHDVGRRVRKVRQERNRAGYGGRQKLDPAQARKIFRNCGMICQRISIRRRRNSLQQVHQQNRCQKQQRYCDPPIGNAAPDFAQTADATASPVKTEENDPGSRKNPKDTGREPPQYPGEKK